MQEDGHVQMQQWKHQISVFPLADVYTFMYHITDKTKNFIVLLLRSYVNWLEQNHCPQKLAQPAFTCSKLIIETLEQGVKHAQN